MENIPKNIKINIINNENSDEVITKYVKVSNDKENTKDEYIIHEINIAPIRKKYENNEELSYFEKMFMMLEVEEVDKLKELAGDDENLNKIIETRKELVEDEEFVKECMDDQISRDIYLAGYSRARFEIKVEKNIRLAKKLLDNKIDKNLITEFTGLTKKELEALK